MEAQPQESARLRLALAIGQARLSRGETHTIAHVPLDATGYVSLPYYVMRRKDGVLFATGEPYPVQTSGYNSDLRFCGSYSHYFALAALPEILSAIREADFEFTYDYLFEFLNEHDLQEAHDAFAQLGKSSCAIEFVDVRWLKALEDGLAGTATLRLSKALEVRRCRIMLSGTQFWLWAPIKRTENQWGIVFEREFETILTEHLRDVVRCTEVPKHLRFAQRQIAATHLHCVDLSA
jgi:hypothetical protein